MNVQFDNRWAFVSSLPAVSPIGGLQGMTVCRGISQRALLAGIIASGMVRVGAEVPVVARMSLVLADEILAQDEEDAALRKPG